MLQNIQYQPNQKKILSCETDQEYNFRAREGI